MPFGPRGEYLIAWGHRVPLDHCNPSEEPRSAQSGSALWLRAFLWLTPCCLCSKDLQYFCINLRALARGSQELAPGTARCGRPLQNLSCSSFELRLGCWHSGIRSDTAYLIQIGVDRFSPMASASGRCVAGDGSRIEIMLPPRCRPVLKGLHLSRFSTFSHCETTRNTCALFVSAIG